MMKKRGKMKINWKEKGLSFLRSTSSWKGGEKIIGKEGGARQKGNAQNHVVCLSIIDGSILRRGGRRGDGFEEGGLTSQGRRG